MRTFIPMLLACSALMSALTLVYMLLNRLLAKRYAEKWRYYAWLIIVVGLIVPFRPSIGEGVIKVEVPERLEKPVLEYENWVMVDPYYGYVYRPAEAAAAPGAGTAETVPGETDAAAETAAPDREAVGHRDEIKISAALFGILTRLSWWDIAAIVWLAGCAAVVGYHIAKHRRFVRMTKRWTDEVGDGWQRELLDGLKAEMRIRGKIGLCYCPFVASPMLAGFVRPRILLPETEFAPGELRLILKHELVHYRRKDVLYRFLLMVATAMHWFNPVVHLVAKSIDTGCEVSCDDEVVRGTDMETRKYYGTTILGVVRHQTKLKTLLSTHLNGGKKTMKKRLSAIFDAGRKRAGYIIGVVVVIAVLVSGYIIMVKPRMLDEDTQKNAAESQTDEEGNITRLNALEQLPETDRLVLWRHVNNKWLLDPAVKIFKRMYPEVEVEIRDFEGAGTLENLMEYVEMIKTEIPAGKGPDLLYDNGSYSDTLDIYKAMDADVFYDMSGLFENDADINLDDYNKAAMDSGIYKGKRYIVPISYMNNIMLTTKEALADAGMVIENTQSFDSLANGVKKYLEEYASTKAIYNTRGYYNGLYFPWCGLSLLDYETKTVNIDNEEVKKVLEAYKDIYMQDRVIYLQDEGYPGTILNTRDAIPAIKSGEIVFFRPYGRRNLIECNAFFKHDYTPVYFPFPAVNGKITGEVYSMASILNAAQNKLNAYRFIKILLSEQIQSGVWDDGIIFSYTPVLIDAVEKQVGYDVKSTNQTRYGGKILSAKLEDYRDYIDMLINIDICNFGDYFESPSWHLYTHMEPYFKGEDTYENCLDKARNFLELYVSE